MQSTLARFAGLSVATLGGFAMFYDLHTGVTINEREMGDKVFVYKQFQGNYWAMNDTLQGLKGDFSSMKPEDVTLSAFYFDNPRMLVNPNKGRGVIGGFFETSRMNQVQEFMKNHPEYKMKEMEPFKALQTSFTYRNYFSFRMSRFKKVRSKVYRYGFQNNKFNNKKELAGMMENFQYLNGKDNTVEVMVPFENIPQFKELNMMPAPQTKTGPMYAGVLGDYNYIFFRN